MGFAYLSVDVVCSAGVRSITRETRHFNCRCEEALNVDLVAANGFRGVTFRNFVLDCGQLRNKSKTVILPVMFKKCLDGCMFRYIRRGYVVYTFSLVVYLQ